MLWHDRILYDPKNAVGTEGNSRGFGLPSVSHYGHSSHSLQHLHPARHNLTCFLQALDNCSRISNTFFSLILQHNPKIERSPDLYDPPFSKTAIFRDPVARSQAIHSTPFEIVLQNQDLGQVFDRTGQYLPPIKAECPLT